MSDTDDRFLSRWSQRKARARQGAAVDAPDSVAPPPGALPTAPTGTAPAGEAIAPAAPPADPPPTLEDVAALTRDSHFGRFVRPDVDPAVKNAALKKLFADPQFNVMDGLDTYIDDYGKPDPLPAAMLRQMAQAKFLGLFADEEAPVAAADPVGPVPGASDLEAPVPVAIVPEALANEDTDLRLQPHDAARCAGAEPGPEPDGGCER